MIKFNIQLFAPDPSAFQITIYSNDGNTQLEYLEGVLGLETANPTQAEVTSTGLHIQGTAGVDFDYIYSGEEVFQGFATSADQTTPIYSVGDTITLEIGFTQQLTLYIVTREQTLTEKVERLIIYGNSQLASKGVSTPQSTIRGVMDSIGDIQTGGGNDNSPQILMRTVSQINDTNGDIKYIEQYGLYNCTKLESVNLPECSYLSSYAFTNCSNVNFTSLTLPKCTSIGFYCFSGCLSLRSVVLPKCNTLARYAFNSCNLLHITKCYFSIRIKYSCIVKE